MNIDQLNRILQQSIGNSTKISSWHPVGGGCINQCYHLVTDSRAYFVKCNKPQYLDMFEREHEGLAALASYGNLLIPKPINNGIVQDSSYLVMEFIKSGSPGAYYWERLGEGLAGLHRQTGNQFGWTTDNYIGRLPQSNHWHHGWIDFFIQERLQPQIKTAVDSGVLPAKVQIDLNKLLGRIDQYIILEPPAFLHGDLWSGNVMTGPEGEPCLMDPAVYYGHREIELAFTKLFGGFDERFYQAYSQSYPLAVGYQQRFDIYNLYPLMVHLNLFGSSYLGDITQILRKNL